MSMGYQNWALKTGILLSTVRLQQVIFTDDGHKSSKTKEIYIRV